MTQSSSSQKDEKVVTLYTKPSEDATTICLDELGPVSPRTYPPAPGCSQDGHRISRCPWNTGGVLRRSGSTERCECGTGKLSRSPTARVTQKATTSCDYSRPSSGRI